MPSPYKRRRRSLVRNLWIYRKLVALAVVVGMLLWFVLTNNERVTIAFPFRLGSFQSTTGLVILLSGLVGSALTALTIALIWALRRDRRELDEPEDVRPLRPASEKDDLPPPDYAAKTGDGLNREGPWS